jgi:GDP-4-dehydro-6-deoxy-D-mannose reductase
MNQVALVTGASGFAGWHLSAWLRSQGWTVREAVNPGVAPGEAAYPCDIANEEQVRRLISWADQVTHVFHLAAVTFVPASCRNPLRTIEINLNGTVYLIAAMSELLPHARLVYVSSAAVYGVPESLPVTETHRLAPKEPYAISKAAADAYCEYLHQSAGADIVRMRPFNHSGPRQPDSFVLSSFAHQIARIEAGLEAPVLRVGNLDAARDFLHVADVVKAYVRERPTASGTRWTCCWRNL